MCIPCRGTQFDIDSMQRTTDDVSQCTPSVECANYKDEAAAVIDIYAIDLRLGAMGLCTGTALPHVITDAWHTTIFFVFVQRNSSLVARYARGKPHPRLKAFGTSAGFSTTHG